MFLDDHNCTKMAFVFVFFIVCAAAEMIHQVKNTQQCKAGGGICKQTCVDREVDTGPCCRNSYRCCQPCNVTCGGIFNEPVGTLTSQNYPLNYCNNHDCNYNIIVDDGFKIMLNFTFFHTEKRYPAGDFWDFVKVYDGEITAAALLGTLYGGPTEGIEFNSTSNKMILHFETDDTIVRPGFSVSYKTFQ